LLLADRLGKSQEAEALLRETMQLFPEYVATRNQLALLLAERLQKPQEAEALLRETIRQFPNDQRNSVVAHTQLANVVGRQSARLQEAIALLDAALKIEPANKIAQSMKRRFEKGQTGSPPQAAMRVASTTAHAVVVLPVDIAASARMRRALFRVRTAEPAAREAAKNEVQAILKGDENLAYARYVAAAAGINEVLPDDSVPAVAYLAAAREGTHDVLQRFGAQLQGLDSVVICLAGASSGDSEATTRLKTWMAEPANDLSPRDHGLRAIAARIVAPLRPDFVGDLLAASLGTAMAA
jgi:tetratricopeptide (TPR) repeat protein